MAMEERHLTRLVLATGLNEMCEMDAKTLGGKSFFMLSLLFLSECMMTSGQGALDLNLSTVW